MTFLDVIEFCLKRSRLGGLSSNLSLAGVEAGPCFIEEQHILGVDLSIFDIPSRTSADVVGTGQDINDPSVAGLAFEAFAKDHDTIIPDIALSLSDKGFQELDLMAIMTCPLYKRKRRIWIKAPVIKGNGMIGPI